jgi:hypothetical protein
MTPEQTMRSELIAAAAFLETMAVKLDAWATQSRGGGWSTHQVEGNIEQARACRMKAADIRSVIVRTG